MGANFLFDGSAESKEQLKLFLLYSDEGFKISPPVYLRRFSTPPPARKSAICAT